MDGDLKERPWREPLLLWTTSDTPERSAGLPDLPRKRLVALVVRDRTERLTLMRRVERVGDRDAAPQPPATPLG